MAIDLCYAKIEKRGVEFIPNDIFIIIIQLARIYTRICGVLSYLSKWFNLSLCTHQIMIVLLARVFIIFYLQQTCVVLFFPRSDFVRLNGTTRGDIIVVIHRTQYTESLEHAQFTLLQISSFASYRNN